MTPVEVMLADIARGETQLASMVDKSIKSERFGDCIGCSDCSKLEDCLLSIIDSLKFRIDNELLDEITESLYIELILIIGKTIIPNSITGYWFITDSSEPLTEEELLSSTPFSFAPGGAMRVPFKVESFSFYGVAYPLSETDKTKYVDSADADNKGDLGTPSDLMGAVSTTENFKQQITNYPSIQITDLILS